MVISKLRIVADVQEREQILEILSSVRGPTEGEPGCHSCCISQELGNEHAIIYEEVWQSLENLHRHIRLPLYRKILAAIDLSNKPPEIRFSTTSKTAGMELIESALGHGDTKETEQGRVRVRRGAKHE